MAQIVARERGQQLRFTLFFFCEIKFMLIMNAPFSVSGAVGFVRSYSLIIPQAEIASQF